MILPSLRDRSGFTLIEVLMVVLIITIMAVVSITVLPDTINESKFNQTIEKMNQIRNAMIGNPEIREGTTRTSFGYLGDVGAIPTLITDLLTKPGGVSAYALNSTVRFGMGWNGAYLTGVNAASSFTTDAWGTALIYTPGASPPTLVSLGADATVGGTSLNQDITHSNGGWIYLSRRRAFHRNGTSGIKLSKCRSVISIRSKFTSSR